MSEERFDYDVAVLDFYTSNIYLYKKALLNVSHKDQDIEERIHDFIESQGHSESQCSYMVGKNIGLGGSRNEDN